MYGLGVRSGLIHNYYSPAVYSMAHSWKAFFWAGYDPMASITLDKLPLAFQVEALSVRLFGFTTWAIIGPQLVEALVATFMLFLTVRRWIGPVAGYLAALLFAFTPIVAALAHGEISDMLLTCLLIVAAYFWTRAMASPGIGWLMLTAVTVAVAFQAKMAQAWGVLPALGLAYLVFAHGTWLTRLWRTLLAGVVAVALSVWWLVLVSLTPAANRPYIDGSETNSAWAMVFQYNLFGRYESGGSGSSGVSGAGGPGGGGDGWSYMVEPSVATQVGWLYPLALVGLVAGLYLRRGKPRTDLVRAGLVMWAVWFLVHGVAFSLGRVAHSFYVIAVAPAVVSLAVAALVLLWQVRDQAWARWTLAGGVLATVAWTIYLGLQYPTFLPWLMPVAAVLCLVGVVLLVLRRAESVAAFLTIAGLVVTPAAWSASTISTQYSGSNIGPAAGPAASQGMGGGGGPSGSRSGGPSGMGTPPSGMGTPPSGMGTPPGGGMPTGGMPTQGASGAPSGGMGGGGMGGASTSEAAETVTWLQQNQPGTKYLLATTNSSSAGPYITAGASVLPMGGFSGSVPFPTTDALAAMVSSGELRYVLISSQGGGGQGGTSETSTWVTTNCTTVSGAPVDGLYDCKK